MKPAIKKIFRQLNVSATMLAVYFLAATPAQAQTRAWSGVCVGSAEGQQDVATLQGLECLIANVFTVIITIIGLAGFVMFVVGAITWMLSGGDTGKLQSAKGSMTYAVIGMVVALSAFIILNLIASFTGISLITQFRIPSSDSGL